MSGCANSVVQTVSLDSYLPSMPKYASGFSPGRLKTNTNRRCIGGRGCSSSSSGSLSGTRTASTMMMMIINPLTLEFHVHNIGGQVGSPITLMLLRSSVDDACKCPSDSSRLANAGLCRGADAVGLPVCICELRLQQRRWMCDCC